MQCVPVLCLSTMGTEGVSAASKQGLLQGVSVLALWLVCLGAALTRRRWLGQLPSCWTAWMGEGACIRGAVKVVPDQLLSCLVLPDSPLDCAVPATAPPNLVAETGTGRLGPRACAGGQGVCLMGEQQVGGGVFLES